MKAKNVSVTVSDFSGELYVMITLKLRNQYLELEASDPSRDAKKGLRVSEANRKKKQKEIQKFLEMIDFPEDDHFQEGSQDVT